MKETKFIFITGGVLSSLGKGLAGASIGALLKARGLNVVIQKLDPYINVNPGNMNPFQHGEVFVTDDGAETDLDLGHYERFLDVSLNQKSSYTSGSIYNRVIRKERRGDYSGGTVQVIPHITDEIKGAIRSLASPDTDVAIVEIGGTVGDIEGLPFLEAIRQLRGDLGKERCLYVHLTLIPYLRSSGEFKTKPTQHSVKELRSIGIQPDILLCRCEANLQVDIKRKLSLFCDVAADAVFSAVDVDNIYSMPLKFYEEGLDQKIIIMLRLPAKNASLSSWKKLLTDFGKATNEVTIGVVGKYVDFRDAYKSTYEALTHGGVANLVTPRVRSINSEDITKQNVGTLFEGLDGILLPGGFGVHGVEGKILAAQYARENKIPFFGICLGMQCAIIEFARNVAGLSKANSEEFDEFTAEKVIFAMNATEHFTATPPNKGSYEPDNSKGNIRLGSYPCKLATASLAHIAYGEEVVHERHSNRYEFNNEYTDLLAAKGMVFSGVFPEGDLVEIIELPNHPWFVGCQFHPEFKSRPMRAHPLFRDFIAAAQKQRQKKSKK